MLIRLMGATVLAALLTAGALCAAEPAYRVTSTVKLGGEGSWDYAAYDAGSDRLFVTRVGGVEAIAAATGAPAGSVPATAGTRVHGVALAPDLGLGLTGEGNDRNVSVFDLKTLAVKRKIAVDHAIDAVVYDPASKRGFAVAGDDNLVAVFAPSSGKKLGEIALDGSPEAAASDGKGRLFVNLSDKNEVAVIDTRHLKVVARWPLGEGCEDPTPLTVDPARGRLFIGCRSGVAVVLDSDDGTRLAALPLGKGADAAVFDPGADLAFIACYDGTITAIRAEERGAAVAQTIKTEAGGRIVALDPVGHRLFVPVADLGPLLPKTEDLPARPAIVPESFRILTISQVPAQ